MAIDGSEVTIYTSYTPGGYIMSKRPLRFALIGAGHIAQSAVIPSFAAIPKDAELVGILSDDPLKRRRLAHESGLPSWNEAQLVKAIAERSFDALYIATPNHRHLEQASAALRGGVHVLLEKPMTVTVAEGQRLAAVEKKSPARLMVAYRLHCDPIYNEVIHRVRSGEIGDPRLFTASFTMQVNEGNIRTKAGVGGGTVHDLGIYCINAARTVFASEPLEVRAIAVAGHDARSRHVDEMTSAILRFPEDRLATFTSSFGAVATSWFEVVGSSGKIRLETAFDLSGQMEMTLERKGRTTRKARRIGDQFAAEIRYFVDCVRAGRDPEPGIDEGLRDMRVIEAVLRAAGGARACMLPAAKPVVGPQPRLVRRVRALKNRAVMVHAKAPSRD